MNSQVSRIPNNELKDFSVFFFGDVNASVDLHDYVADIRWFLEHLLTWHTTIVEVELCNVVIGKQCGNETVEAIGKHGFESVIDVVC